MEETVPGVVQTSENQNAMMKHSKPLHRFTQNQPRSFGIVVLMFGCAEVVMGFVMAGADLQTSFSLYIPFWQGTMFLVCGVLSIYTELHPSKKTVTICLAMSVVSMLGIVLSFGYRIYFLIDSTYPYSYYNKGPYLEAQLSIVVGMLFGSSLFVFGVLVFFAVIARAALKSTHDQVIIQHIAMQPQSELST
ncbi:PREDICTED: uncharacterized protein LOC107098620 isoform X2 [Cyprinodon variegatus]|uniref:Uncharacterized LOC107098620 n=2 Tax=Cyprinodon variegatus TaxID=28743 RepID=A0A3Q2DIR3_CYPVA|nr:PREDICTED: uncharacterized protein LOC107098620 isoform X2 [Cyprinodon variegatus]XP_015251878.1 PREDICTED: uncharacterized protein LOC107098620 isoform X2 [Cyprinodon variegatus]